jgi:hypothetical protein
MTRSIAALLAFALGLPGTSRADTAAEAAPPWPRSTAVALPGQEHEAYAQYEAELNRFVASATQDGASGAPASATSDGPTCLLFIRDAPRVSSQQCMECHRSATHPVDLDYGAAQLQRPSSLRPPAEVIQRGVFLPEGQIRCVTCHDGRSPWMHRIALPPGAEARPAVNPHAPATYETTLATAPRIRPLPGAAVTPTPLCKSCHTIGD